VFLPDEAESLLGTSGKPALIERLVALALKALELVLDILKVPPDSELAAEADEMWPGSPWDFSHIRNEGIDEQ
jgi:hypothetical protein